jgi:hypothetical protein
MSRDRDQKSVQRRPAESAEESADAGRFVRGLTIGLIVGAVIAGSTLWRRFGPLRPRS